MVVARFDTDALRHNVAFIRERAPNSRLMAVVKANAYGHGMLAAARAMDADAFAVARVDEGIRLREAGELRPILVLEGCHQPSEMSLASNESVLFSIAETFSIKGNTITSKK